MNKITFLTLAFSSLILAIGCSKSHNDQQPVSANTTMNEVRDILEPVGLGFYGDGERGFRTDGKIVEPCAQPLLGALDAAVTKLEAVQSQLPSQDSLKSLVNVQKELGRYCSLDHSKVESCLQPGGKVLTFLNRDVLESPPVSPVLVPFDVSTFSQDNWNYGIYRLNPYEGGAVGVGFVEFKKNGRAYPNKLDAKVAKFYSENQNQLKEMSQCLDSASLQSATGKLIQSFASAAATERY